MIKLICQKCNHIWYTANTKPNQKCGECGGYLREVDMISAKEFKKAPVVLNENKNEHKIIHIDFN